MNINKNKESTKKAPKNIEAYEYFKAKDAAKTLKIASSTLRKYAKILEDANLIYFQKDNNLRRIYSNEQIELLKDTIQLKKDKNISLINAYDIVKSEENSSRDIAQDIAGVAPNVAPELVKNLFVEFKKLNQNNENLSIEIKQLKDENKELKNLINKQNENNQNKLNTIIDKLDNLKKPKKKFFGLFNKH